MTILAVATVFALSDDPEKRRSFRAGLARLTHYRLPALRSLLMGLGALLLYGSWALVANLEHGPWLASKAALTQGFVSLTITVVITAAMEIAVRQAPRGILQLLAPFAVAELLAVSYTVGLHWLSGTPELLRTVLPVLCVGGVYCLVYSANLAREARVADPGEVGEIFSFVDRALSPMLRLLVRCAGYRTSLVSGEEGLREACAFRHAQYRLRSAGSAKGHECTGGPDRYDRNALQVVARHRGEIVGTLRLVDSTVDSPVLDVAQVEFPAGVTPNRRTELSGLSVSPAHRGRGRLVFLGMLDLAVRHAAAWNRPYLVCLFHRKQLAPFLGICPEMRHLEAALRPDCRLPDYMRERIVSRWDDYRLVVFDLRDVSWSRNIKRMVVGRLGLWAGKLPGGIAATGR